MTPRNTHVRYHTEVEGTDVQHWRDDDGVIVIAFGKDLDDVARKRLEREILAEYGIRRRHAAPMLLGMDTSWLADRAPVITAGVAGAAVSAVAIIGVPAILDAQQPHRSPPIAGPQRPSTAPTQPSVAPRPRSRPPRQRPSPTSERGTDQQPSATEPISELLLPGGGPDRQLPLVRPSVPGLPTKPILPTPTEIPVPSPPPRCLKVNINGETLLTLLCWPRRGGEAA